ncbi:hypothetical protein HY380_00245 [Candidatus Saccharibacteria bacterium]|nr:hypothetical protein [Candidatus Saccharibacteria bacterium]
MKQKRKWLLPFLNKELDQYRKMPYKELTDYIDDEVFLDANNRDMSRKNKVLTRDESAYSIRIRFRRIKLSGSRRGIKAIGKIDGSNIYEKYPKGFIESSFVMRPDGKLIGRQSKVRPGARLI